MGAFNGVGQFIRSYLWANDASNGINITASRMDTEDNGFAAGLSNCVTRDGQSPPTANLPMAGFKLTGMAAASSNGEAVIYEQLTALSAASITFTPTGYSPRTIQAKLLDFPTPQDAFALEATSQGIGTGVLKAITTGVKNTAFGYLALQNTTDGSENTAFGYLALSNVVGGTDPAGDFNTAFGSFALASLTTGSKNAAFGRAAADNLTTGSMNTAHGYGSFHWATTAQNCTAVGFEAVHGGSVGPITAQGITGVGFRALYECLADFNTAVGTSAGASITTGARNTALGTNALNTLVTGSDNVGLGNGAGLNNTGSGNIFIGSGADANAGRSNVTVIGSSMSATADNTLLLGNAQTIIPGTTSADIGTQAKPWNFGIFQAALWAYNTTAIPTGGTAGKGLLLSSTSNFGTFFGSGAPTLTAAKGSLYLRSDGSATNNRMYVNTDGGTTWTAVTTAA